MQFSSFRDDIVDRIAATRLARCGGPKWVEPPVLWTDIVRESWPDVWCEVPAWLPPGWCDLIMSFSQHALEIAGIARYYDAFENVIDGRL